MALRGERDDEDDVGDWDWGCDGGVWGGWIVWERRVDLRFLVRYVGVKTGGNQRSAANDILWGIA